MLVEPVGSALIVGKLKGGKINYILNIEINGLMLIILAALIQSVATVIVSKEITPYWQSIKDNGIWLQLIVYALLIWGGIVNLRLKGMSLIIFGIILNFIVIMANGGRMPVNISGVEHLLSEESISVLQNAKSLTHIAANDSTKFLFLGDIIHLKRPYPLPKSLSIGDIFMMIGIFRLIFKALLNDVYIKSKKIFRYNHH